MAASTRFKRDDSVLWFNPRDHVGGASYQQRRYLLWPTWVYRVIAPSSENRRLNILQKAVLGLCNAGIFEVRRVADSLDIHPNLAKEIILELQQDGLVGSRGLPTDKGRETLQNETVNRGESMTVGHIFQDPTTGKLWPRFVQELNYAELHYEDEYPRLVLGKKGKPFYKWTYQYLPQGLSEFFTQPNSRQIIDAVRQHKRAKRYGVEWIVADDDYTSYADKELEGRLQQVSLVDDYPQAMFLATYLYLDETDGDWYVCDPFGFGPSLFLRRVVDKQIKEATASGLRDQIQALLRRGLDTNLEDIAQWHQLLAQQAEIKVDEHAPNARQIGIYQDLLAMETAYQEIETHQDNFSNMKADAVINTTRKILEALFANMLAEYPSTQPSQIWKQIPSNHPAETYNEIISQVGFKVPIPRNLSAVKKMKLKGVIEYSNAWNLRPLIISCLLIANESSNHPLREVASRQPDFLEILEELIDAGGKASHHNKDNEIWNFKKIKTLRGKIYNIINLFKF